MAELCVNIPDELMREAEHSNLDLPGLVKKYVELKLFEKRLSESIALQRAVFESLASKSKLTKDGARQLADQVNAGVLEELKNRFPDL